MFLGIVLFIMFFDRIGLMSMLLFFICLLVFCRFLISFVYLFFSFFVLVFLIFVILLLSLLMFFVVEFNIGFVKLMDRDLI